MMQSIGVGGTVEAGEMNVSWLTFDNSNERLGIGTTSPSGDLHIQGEAGDQARLYITDGDDTGASNSLLISVSGSNASIYNRKADATLRLGTNDQNDIFKIIGTGTPAANTLVLDEGNVAIGASVPLAKLHVDGDVCFESGNELTIASGAITVTHSLHGVDTEADASTDDLDTINGGVDGQIVVLKAQDNTRDVVVKDGTGNLRLAGDFTMDNSNDTITLMYIGSTWNEISRSNNQV